MATYTYTGKLTDFGEAPFPSSQPRLSVLAEEDTFGPTGLLAAKPIPVTVATDGSFSVQLVATVDTSPEARYGLRCEWLALDTSGLSYVVGWSDWTFTAAIGGGLIKNMVSAPASVWVVGPPWPSVIVPGAFYFDTTTNDVGRA